MIEQFEVKLHGSHYPLCGGFADNWDTGQFVLGSALQVDSGGPAGGDVITAIDDQSVTGILQLRSILSQMEPDLDVSRRSCGRGKPWRCPSRWGSKTMIPAYHCVGSCKGPN
jgi:hypothetical protein